MGITKIPQPVNLIVGAIYSHPEIETIAKNRLIEVHGDTDHESPALPFHHTKYYEKEMGTNLNRKFYSFRELIQPERIVEIKLQTNEMEKEFAAMENDTLKRRINLDPGYADTSKLVLATTKNYTHRVYLRDGIYAEVTLKYHDKTFHPYEWTYPDYRTEDYIAFFNEVRRLYREKLKFSQ